MKTQENLLNITITEILLNLKLDPKSSGFDFLKMAVILAYKNKEKTLAIKEIYKQIAKEKGSTSLFVEKSIRSSIENSFCSGGLLFINDYFGNVVYNNNFIPSNSEFINLLAEIVKLRTIKYEFI